MAISNLARAASVVALLSGCTPAPTTPVPTIGQSTTAAPSVPPPSTAAGPQVAWARFAQLDEMVDMVHGESGWVALAACELGSCTTSTTVWRSEDLGVWEAIQLPRSGDLDPISVSANSDGYVVAAYDYDRAGGALIAFIQVWRSFDGRSWDRVGELRLGTCQGQDCPRVRGVGLAPDGAIVVGAVSEGEDDTKPTRSFVSDDGLTWRETTIATATEGLKISEVVVQGATSTPTNLFLFGFACTSSGACRLTVWSSIDGERWVTEQDFGRDGDRVRLASDGTQRVATVTGCRTLVPLDCTTDVWAGAGSTAWTKVAAALDLAVPEIAWTGEAFVLVGERDGRYVTYVSEDGTTWTETPSTALGERNNCRDEWLAGGPGAVMYGVPACGIWKGTIQTAP